MPYPSNAGYPNARYPNARYPDTSDTPIPLIPQCQIPKPVSRHKDKYLRLIKQSQHPHGYGVFVSLFFSIQD
mgnify:FL=1